MTEKGRKVVNHMDKDLTDDQKDDIGKAVIYAVEDHGLDYTKLKNDKHLHALLYPYLEERSEDWDGVEGHPEWKASSKAYNTFYHTLKNHLQREGRWIQLQLNRKQEKAKETPNPDDHEDQPEAPKMEKSKMVVTRYQGKRTAPENDTLYQQTIPELNTKRPRIEKQDRAEKLPAKTPGYQIVESQPLKNMTQEEAFKELHLTNENMMLQIMQVNQLKDRREALMGIIRPTITDPMNNLK